MLVLSCRSMSHRPHRGRSVWFYVTNLIFCTAGSHDRRSPSLGADLAALFPTMGSLEGRQVMSQLGSGPANSDTPQPSAASSLDRILSDLGSSDVLQERK